jgi:hypothetical protein
MLLPLQNRSMSDPYGQSGSALPRYLVCACDGPRRTTIMEFHAKYVSTESAVGGLWGLWA